MEILLIIQIININNISYNKINYCTATINILIRKKEVILRPYNLILLYNILCKRRTRIKFLSYFLLSFHCLALCIIFYYYFDK